MFILFALGFVIVIMGLMVGVNWLMIRKRPKELPNQD